MTQILVIFYKSKWTHQGLVDLGLLMEHQMVKRMGIQIIQVDKQTTYMKAADRKAQFLINTE